MSEDKVTVDPDAASGEDRKEDTKRPSTWWQWVLIYPALAVALISAVPDWISGASEAIRQLRGDDPATELVRFMQRNDECVRSPVRYYQSPENTKVDGTICSRTGDVFLRIQTVDGSVVYKGIFVDELVAMNDAPGPFAMTAFAAGVTAPQAPPVRDRLSALVQAQFSIVLCQTINSNGTIVRHLKEGDQCYDETIDAKTGRVTSRREVACREDC